MIKGRLMHQGDYIANQPDTLQKNKLFAG